MGTANYYGGANSSAMLGDVYPSNFSWLSPLTARDLLALYKRNEYIQLSVDWMSWEAFRKGISFINEDEVVVGDKFGQEYIFKGYDFETSDSQVIHISAFQEFLMWIDAWKQIMTGVAWSRLYDEGSLIVFLDDTIPELSEPGTDDRIWRANPNPQGYMRFIVIQPLQAGNSIGFTVDNEKWDELTNEVKEYRVQIKRGEKTINYFIEADRCIHLLWRKKENGWKGFSRVKSFAHIALSEEQFTKRLLQRAAKVVGGILTIDAESNEEMDALDNAIGTDLTSIDRIYKKPGREIEYKTPDLKAAGEMASIFEIYSKKLCRHMRISQLMLDGEHTGASLGGNDNAEIMNSYSEIFQIQEHYRNDLEKIFFKLGKKDTRFVYVDILPENMMSEDEINDGGKEETDSSSVQPGDWGDKGRNPKDGTD